MGKIHKLYIKSFPKNERKPYWFMKINKGHEITPFIENEIFVGFYILYFCDDLILLDYLAIEPKYQGNGYGSKILSEIKEKYGDKKIIIEIETPGDDKLKLRRKSFYLKNGFFDTGINVHIFGTDFLLLSNKEITREEHKSIYKKMVGLR